MTTITAPIPGHSPLGHSQLLPAWRPSALLCLLAIGAGLVMGCSPLEPIVEPEISDLQLTVDSLKTSVRDAQRTIGELRTELDARRQALAEAQVARAQFEGRTREAERRLTEARHVVDLQRDELATSRAERERVARTSALLQNQLKQLQRQLTKLGKQAGRDTDPALAPARLSSPKGRALGRVPARLEPKAAHENSLKATTANLLSASASSGENRSASSTNPPRVSVKPGDTLWSIARRYRMDIDWLRAINQLQDDRIQVGQAVWLTTPPEVGGVSNGSAE